MAAAVLPFIGGALLGGMVSKQKAEKSAAKNAAQAQTQAAQAAQAAQTAPSAPSATTVDPQAASNTSQLGRAALISTSPMGVQGSDDTGRRRLLGN